MQTVQMAVNVPANQTGEADATCPAGELRTGGGYEVFNVSANWSIYLNAPLNTDTWTVEIDNEVTNATTITSYAQCLAKKNSEPITALRSTPSRRLRPSRRTRSRPLTSIAALNR
jgi:hypothetical protein